MNNSPIAEIAEKLKDASEILLISHVAPDGDTLGSVLALYNGLKKQGKQVTASCANPVPSYCSVLPGADEVLLPEQLPKKKWELAMAVDVASADRMGEALLEIFSDAERNAQIDHHHTNEGYAMFNHVRSPLSATGVIACDVLDALGVNISREIGECLFAAVSTDTGSFKFGNTDTEALRVASRCVEAGIDIAALTRVLFDVQRRSKTALLGRALSGLRLLENGTVAVMALYREDFEACEALPEDTEGIVNYGINTEGVRAACLINQPMEDLKCSLRAVYPVDVSKIASRFGGGGHAQAAGCTLRGMGREEALEMITKALIDEVRSTK